MFVRRSLEFVGIQPARQKEALPDTATVPDFLLSFYVAMSDFAHSMDKLNEKRRWLQQRRVRSDQELLPLFYFALQPSIDDPAYVELHNRLCRAFGLDRRFAAGQTLTFSEAGLGPAAER